MKVRIAEGGTLHCPKCNAGMRKLYWVYPSQHQPDRIVFSNWYGCTDCGECIYDKHHDVILSQFKEKDDNE